MVSKSTREFICMQVQRSLTLQRYRDGDDLVLVGLDIGIVRYCITALFHYGYGIKSLSVGYGTTGLSVDDIKMLTTGLSHHNTTITDLYITNTGTGDKGMKHVADLLEQNTTIKTLVLDHNGIGDKGVLALGAALLNNKRSAVTVLYLNNNSIEILPDCFALLTSLNRLILHGNPLRDPPIALVGDGRGGQAALFGYLADKRKRMVNFHFLLGFHVRVGHMSSIQYYLCRSAIFEPALLGVIFQMLP